MNVLIQFELLVCSLKPPCLGNKPCYMPCLTGASNVFFSVVVAGLLFFVFFSWKIQSFPYWKISSTGEPSSLHYQTSVWFICCSNAAAGTATSPMLRFPPWGVISCGALWVVRFFKNGGGGLLQNLMLEGDPEVPFTSPSAISQSHMASALAEQSGRSACGRKSGLRNLYPQSNANFQFNKLGKQEHNHTEHSGQEPLECHLSWIAVDSRMDSAASMCFQCQNIKHAPSLIVHMHYLMEMKAHWNDLQRVQPERRRKSTSRAKLNWERTGRGEINSRYAFLKEFKVHYCSSVNTAE